MYNNKMGKNQALLIKRGGNKGNHLEKQSTVKIF